VEESRGRRLLIRADATEDMGTGHLMRCLALAQAWQDRGGTAAFITACESEQLRARLVREGFLVIPIERPHPDPADWQITSGTLEEHPGAWVVLDGYHFDSPYQRQIKDSGHPLLAIDDMAHLRQYFADVILNQNLHASDLRYVCPSHTRVFLGVQYAVLRREFLEWRTWKRKMPRVARRLLVTIGGGDPDNVTLKVMHALNEVSAALEAVVVVGPANPHYDALESAVRDSRQAISLVLNSSDMPKLMAWADIAVSAAGSTCWELAFMGLPALLLSVAENQQRTARALAAERAAIVLGTDSALTVREIVCQLEMLVNSPRERMVLCRHARRLGVGAKAASILRTLYPSPVAEVRE